MEENEKDINSNPEDIQKKEDEVLNLSEEILKEAEEIQKESERIQELEEELQELDEEILTHEEEIETEWAEALHLDYDPIEARRRAENATTPPPMPASQMPPTPGATVPPPMPGAPVPPPAAGTPSQPVAYGHPEPMPATYLVWSVLATVLCCFIPGIVAIVYSTMVSSKYYAKDYDGARKASEKAQIWIIASIVLGIVTATVYMPLSLLG